MALTKRQEITLYSVLYIPYSTTVFRLQDVDNLLVLAISVEDSNRVAHIRIQERLAQIALVPELEDDLSACLDQWYDMFGDSTQMDGGGIGATTGVSFDLKEERRMLRERILALVPFSKDFIAGELSKTQSSRLGITAIR